MCPGFLWFTFIQHILATRDSVSRCTTFQSENRPQFFQQSTTLHSLYFSICQCEMNYATFFSHLLIFLTCEFILLSVALSVQ